MGIPIYQEDYTEQDYSKYQVRLREQLAVLAEMIKTPGFGGEIHSFGAELEVYITDLKGYAMPINKPLLLQIGDPRICLELNKYNLEYNLSPVSASGRPFSNLKQELEEIQELVDLSAKELSVQSVAIGILPTLKKSDVCVENMTDLSRYRALSKGLQQLRGSTHGVQINGKEPLNFKCNDITLEGANSAFHFHIRTPLDSFTNTWNALQLVTPLVLALSANSPLLFSHRLWQETRIALFKESMDNRQPANLTWPKPARVNYGQGWLRHGPLELFQENVSLFDPVLPALSMQDAADTLSQGELPNLDELRLHQSTIWSWNRVVFDPEHNGHFRIQCRTLPSGPSNEDMVANAALLAGLAFGLREQITDWLPAFPFALAEHNFYRAAQNGLDAEILWPDTEAVGPREHPVRNLLSDLLPQAEAGLLALGVETDEIHHYLDNIQRRLDCKITGASWQLETLAYYSQHHTMDDALEHMLKDYVNQQKRGISISQWERPYA